MSLTDDCIAILRMSHDTDDLRQFFENCKTMCRKQKIPVPQIVIDEKDRRKALHEVAVLDKTLDDLRRAMFVLKKDAAAPKWVFGVGWGTLKKAKAAGASFTMDATTEKRVKDILRMVEPEEDLIE